MGKKGVDVERVNENVEQHPSNNISIVRRAILCFRARQNWSFVRYRKLRIKISVLNFMKVLNLFLKIIERKTFESKTLGKNPQMKT